MNNRYSSILFLPVWRCLTRRELESFSRQRFISKQRKRRAIAMQKQCN